MTQVPESQCPVTRGEVDLDFYAERDQVWRAIGISAPARRGLIDAKILQVKDLARFTKREVEAIHGIGKTSMPKLVAAMKQAGIDFK